MDVRTVQDLSATARGRRRDLGLAQQVVAERAAVSRAWLVDFEAGKPTVELGKVLAVLGALSMTLTVTDGSARATEARTQTEAPFRTEDLDALLDAYDRGTDAPEPP